MKEAVIYTLIVMYGLLHCVLTNKWIEAAVMAILTMAGGYVIYTIFKSRNIKEEEG